MIADCFLLAGPPPSRSTREARIEALRRRILPHVSPGPGISNRYLARDEWDVELAFGHFVADRAANEAEDAVNVASPLRPFPTSAHGTTHQTLSQIGTEQKVESKDNPRAIDARLRQALRRANLPDSESVEQERRDAPAALRLAINANRPAEAQINMAATRPRRGRL